MSPERWEQVKAVFDEAYRLDALDRPAYLEEICLGDAELRTEVERLLQYDIDTVDFVPAPIHRAADMVRRLPDGVITLSPGEIIAGRFRVLRLLGRGGMGEVYEAEDRLSHDRVALKTIRASLEDDGGVTERFRREVQLARQVTHPNVCRIHDLYVDVAPLAAGSPRAVTFLSMELLSGVTLKDHVHTHGPFSCQEALPLVGQMAGALDAAHAEGVIHRDFKSSNVMLVRDKSGALRIKVTDFGLACLVPASESIIHEASIAGTPDYMAPEQLIGSEVGTACDVYGLGVVLFEMLTGHLPFPATSNLVEARTHRERPPISPRQFLPTLDPRWETSILQCLDRDPGKRPPNGSALVRALDPKGETSLARRALLVAAAATTPLIGGAILVHQFQPSFLRFGMPPVAAIAVLPLEDATASQELAAISEGLSEELIRALASIPNLRVAGRNSSFQFKGSVLPRNEIASRLNVDALLAGSVRRDGDLVRVSVELLHGATGARLWNQTYDHPARTIATIQERLARSIADVLRMHLPNEEAAHLARRHSSNPEATEAYLVGKQLAGRGTEEFLRQALESFQKAIQLDQNYAVAHLGASEVLNRLAGSTGFPVTEAFGKAEHSARRALELDPRLPEAHLALGAIYQRYHWDWATADGYFQAALQLGPGLAQAHHWYAGFLSNLGYHDRAIEEIRRARELDVLSILVNAAYAAFLHRARRYDEAIQHFHLVLKLDPNYAFAYLGLAQVFSAKGMWEQAIANCRQADDLARSSRTIQAQLGYALARAGRTEEARAILAQFERAWPSEQFYPSTVALIYKGLDDFNKYFEWMDVAYRMRDPNLQILKVDPSNDPIRSDTRFVRLTTLLQLP